MIRVVLADDHRIVLDGIKAAIESDEVEVVGCAIDGEEAARLLCDLQPDIAILDIEMPGLNGINVIRACPDVKIILLTMYSSEMSIVNAINAGARGYLIKAEHDGHDILTAIRRVMQDGYYLPRVVMDSIHAGDIKLQDTRSGSLSPREMNVLEFIGTGCSVQEIAERMNVTSNTVYTYIQRLQQKLHVQSTTALVRTAINMGLT